MDKIKILILDDDSTFLSALKAFLTESGYDVYATNSPEEAKSLIQFNSIQNLIIDCLLPGESGIDFVKSIKQMGVKFETILMISGFFTDPSFIKETITETEVKDFLQKPFDNKKLLSLLPKSLKETDSFISLSNISRKSLYQIFVSTSRDNRQMRKLFESIDVIHGYDLPLIYNLLIESKITGFLNLSGEDGNIFGVTFCKGHIISVDLDDKETFLGKLLIEHGFLTSGDLEQILHKKGNRKLGEVLISDYMISPHALDLCMSEQMGIRLSRTITDQNIKFNFSQSEIELTLPTIDLELFNSYLHDWINSKLNIDWLRTQLVEWRFSYIRKSEVCEDRIKEIESFNIFQSRQDLKNEILSEFLLDPLFEKYGLKEENFFKMIFLLLTKGAIFLEEKDISDFPEKVASFNELNQSLSQSTVDGRLIILSKYVKVPLDNLEMLKEVVYNYILPFEKSKNAQINSTVASLKLKIKETFELVLGDGKKKALNQAKQNASMDAIRLVDEGKALIMKGQYREARIKLEESIKIYYKLPKQRLYYLWAKLQTQSTSGNPETLKEIESDLLKVEPEDKHEAVYHFVMGLFYKAKSNKEQAYKSFEKALALDVQFIQARRELVLARSQGAKKVGVLEADLKNLVSQLFTKKRAK